MLINYLIEKGESEEIDYSSNNVPNTHKSKNQRIRVNDKTATGGWF